MSMSALGTKINGYRYDGTPGLVKYSLTICFQYDDPQTLKMKLDYANSICLGGIYKDSEHLAPHH